MQRGRPRKIREVSAVDAVENVQDNLVKPDPIVENKPESKALDKKYFIPQIAKGKKAIIPYNALEKLNIGDTRYFVNGNPTTGYKLIRVYKTIDAVAPKNGERQIRMKRSLERTLKPRKRTLRGSVDRDILSRLKTIGVPGIL